MSDADGAGDSGESLLESARWSEADTRAWWDGRAWMVGCNFSPSTASNQLEMWQASHFDPETCARELAWAAGLGFNAVRVYLHDLVWEDDRQGFRDRIDRFLDIAAGCGIDVMLVLFDDVWSTDPHLGEQASPHPGRHNSRWVQSPGLPALQRYPGDAALRRRLEEYVTGVLSAFERDERVAVWDLYNEPGGYPYPLADPVGEACLPLLRDVFAWARGVAPSQPVTSGLWWSPLTPLPEEIAEIQLAGSDVVSFHHYGPLDDLAKTVDGLRERTGRPLICTEYLARPLHSRFESHLPFFREQRIGAIHWGLVSGRTQTIWPWWSWLDEEPAPEPEVWFHDVLRPDGTPFDESEANFLRGLLLALHEEAGSGA